MKELGIGLVPYSPLGRGFLTGTLDRTKFDENDFRARSPRFVGEAGDANETIVRSVTDIATRIGATPAQVALAWVGHQSVRLGISVVPIPGTKRIKWLEQNVGALDLELDAETLATLDGLGEHVVGARY
jgi:aryl-alcohol dehydrogenase-like predicted oxidoreductase